jgi:Ca-activated chloride channel homolog
MPHFANPWFLLLLLLLPPVLWWWLRQRRAALRYPATGWLASLPAGRSHVAERGGAVLRALALGLLVLGLAGPRWPDQRTRIPAEGIAVVMLVDVSGSMAEPDFNWMGKPISRLEAVKKVFRLFVEGDEQDTHRFPGRPEDLVGLVTFATRPESPCPLTLSHSVLLRLLEGEQPRSVPGDSETNISDAIVMGMHRLKAAGSRRKVMVLLSDGEHNVPSPQSEWTPRQAAQIAANLGVPVYTIDAGGTTSPGREPGAKNDTIATREAGSQALREVAHITRGQYFPAHDTEALLKVCQTIDRLERSEIASFQYRRYYEAFPWFGLASFALWVTVSLLELTFWRRVP